MRTPLGKILATIRLHSGEKLHEMAEKLGYSSVFLSMIELGKKTPPEGFYELILDNYEIKHKMKLFLAIAQGRKRFQIDVQEVEEQKLVSLLFLGIRQLPKEELKEICSFFEEKLKTLFASAPEAQDEN